MATPERHLFVIGRQHGPVVELARRCAWHPGGPVWMTAEDMAKAARGARSTDGMCQECAERFEAGDGLSPIPAA